MSTHPYERYLERRKLGQFNAFDFFDFSAFSSDLKPEAVFQWKMFSPPFVQQRDPVQFNSLNTS